MVLHETIHVKKKNIKKKSRKSLKKVQTLSLISSLEEDDKKHLGMEEWLAGMILLNIPFSCFLL